MPLNLDEGDELIAVCRTDGEQDVILVTHNGMAIRFQEQDVRCMGPGCGGRPGHPLERRGLPGGRRRDQSGGQPADHHGNGFGKRTAIEEYTCQSRGGYGNKNYNITEKTGPVASAAIVEECDDALMISDDGTIIRTAVQRHQPLWPGHPGS